MLVDNIEIISYIEFVVNGIKWSPARCTAT